MKNNNQIYSLILISVIYSSMFTFMKAFGIITISWLYVLLPIVLYFIFIAVVIFVVVFYYSDEIDKDVK